MSRNNSRAGRVVGLGADPLRQGIASAGEITCVFRDSAFTDDMTKTNLAAILERYGIKNVRSL
uniref:hypothetical protein n=1 Tax=Castellaniella defragrans TaxID=75697 RepID=UPI00334077F7